MEIIRNTTFRANDRASRVDGACAFTAHGRLLDPVDATLAWNDLMNPADTQFTICQFQEAEEGAHP